MARRLWVFLLLAGSLFLTESALAIKLHDTKVVVPIIGRFTGVTPRSGARMSSSEAAMAPPSTYA